MATETPKAAAAGAKQQEAAEAESTGPDAHIERVNMAGLVLEKTAYPDGECKTRVISQPMIAPELIRATTAAQRAAGH